jgi:RpiR family carbohydrate utilization transcriptional regulator
MAALTMTPRDALVAISNTGETATIVACVAAARERGARVVAITGAGDSALARAADAVLVAETHENTNAYTPATSRLAALVVIDILATGMALRLAPAEIARVTDMKRSLARMRRSDGA